MTIMHLDLGFPTIHRTNPPPMIDGDQHCPLGDQRGDVEWFAVQALMATLNMTVIMMNIFFIIICKRSGVIHKHMRVMLSMISFCLVMNAAACLFYNVYFVYLGVVGFPLEPQQNLWCAVVNTLIVPWDTATCLLMVGVGAERIVATKNRLTTGVISNGVKVIFLLAGCIIVFVTINYFLNLTDKGVCICDGASLPNRYAMLIRISVCTVVEVGTISLFGYVLIFCRSEADSLDTNMAKYSLSERFQIHETYRITQMLLPSAVVHVVLYLSYLCLLIPVRNISYRSDHDRRVDFHVVPERHAEIIATFWDRQEQRGL
uniref:G_PROTEIN_RECEP_F1_2 domain-containing protein n=1 Tax=Angiostrongylus cantonensis TaxID=6313 RepID=A0A158P884_ANGCA